MSNKLLSPLLLLTGTANFRLSLSLLEPVGVGGLSFYTILLDALKLDYCFGAVSSYCLSALRFEFWSLEDDEVWGFLVMLYFEGYRAEISLALLDRFKMGTTGVSGIDLL